MQGTLENYFSLIARDLILSLGQDNDWVHPSPRFDVASWQESMERLVKQPADFAGREAWLAAVLLTGYKFGDNLYHNYRDNVELFPNTVHKGWEEGLANYIASGLTGVSLETMQQIAHQDPSSIHFAKRLHEAGIPATEMAQSINTQAKLYELVLSIES